MSVSLLAEVVASEGRRAGQRGATGLHRNKSWVQIQNKLVQLLYGLVNVRGQRFQVLVRVGRTVAVATARLTVPQPPLHRTPPTGHLRKPLPCAFVETPFSVHLREGLFDHLLLSDPAVRRRLAVRHVLAGNGAHPPQGGPLFRRAGLTPHRLGLVVVQGGGLFFSGRRLCVDGASQRQRHACRRA